MSLIDEIHYSTRTSITNGSEFRELFYDAKYLTDASYLILNAITLSQHCYSHMFYGCSSLTDAPELPATSLATYCYSYMFAGCSSLSRSPKLNSTNLQTYCYSYMFQNCTNLVLVSELPAEILYNGCYKGMFYGCNKLSNAPRLIATTLYDSCYYEMFYGCTSLTIAPALPATTLASNCYNSMFRATSLIAAPNLSATIMAPSCYCNMFYGCTELIQAPSLNSMSLASSCYEGMFAYCSKLRIAPELLATTLTTKCYCSMFESCTLLTKSPELNAISLVTRCYEKMFFNCSTLSSIKVMCENNISGNTVQWMDNVAQNGVFFKSKNTTWTIGTGGIPSGWVESTYECFYIEDVSGFDNTISIIKEEGEYAPVITIEKSNNGNSWDVVGITGETPLHITIPANSKVYIRSNDATTWAYGKYENNYFKIRDSCNIGGNIVSLIGNKELIDPYTFTRLFNNTEIIDASKLVLPNNVTGHCYDGMFEDCRSLTAVPSLPATVLAECCYSHMFRYCSSLTTVPSDLLPAIKLDHGCYECMFYYCSSLTTAPVLPATTMANWCYAEMFANCISLINAPALPATTLAEACYIDMFRDCTSLTSIILPATSIKDAYNCYDFMLGGCTSLSYIKAMFIDWNNEFYLFGSNFAENGIFVKNTLATWDESSVYFIPDGWTVIDEIS